MVNCDAKLRNIHQNMQKQADKKIDLAMVQHNCNVHQLHDNYKCGNMMDILNVQSKELGSEIKKKSTEFSKTCGLNRKRK